MAEADGTREDQVEASPARISCSKKFLILGGIPEKSRSPKIRLWWTSWIRIKRGGRLTDALDDRVGRIEFNDRSQ